MSVGSPTVDIMQPCPALDPDGTRPCPTWASLLAGVAEVFDGPADPFVTDTLIVPTFGHGRYIAQYLSGHAGSGICAGITMVTPQQLAQQLAGSPQDNPWSAEAMTLAIADLQSLDAAWRPAGVAPHDFAFASHAASLFNGYLRHCPAMLQTWQDGFDQAADGTPLPGSLMWQPGLWRALVRHLAPAAHPGAMRQLAAQRLDQLPGRLAGVVIHQADPIDQPLWEALVARGAPVFAYRPEVLRPDPPTSLLSAVQAELATGVAPPSQRVADGSVQIHASHGPNRQVEVLRDVLCAAFDELPGLQPRDVLVLCPDLDAYAPLIETAFAASGAHPAGQLRVRVTQRRLNPVLDGLIDVLALATSRATADDLLSWCRRAPVARCFGFGPDDLDRLDDLVRQSGIVWGLDKAQRSAEGVPARNGTWLDGVQRLTIALATSSPLGATGLPPAEGVSLEDGELVGALAELVSRLRRAVLTTSEPAPLPVWADRLRQITNDLLAVDPVNAWPWEAANAIFAGWRRLTSEAMLTRSDVAALLRRRAVSSSRPVDGNGSLQVRRLGDLAGVSFRVVCLLGLSDATFPSRPALRADDLAGLGSDTTRRAARTALRDGLLAAADRFIVTTQGVDERTGATLPAPIAVMDLLAWCGVPGPAGAWEAGEPGDGPRLVRRHPLQPHAWSNFTMDGDQPPASYDRQALAAALRLAEGPPVDPPLPWTAFPGLVAPTTADISLEQVEQCLANPARYLLRHGCGLQVYDIAPPQPDRLPVELDALSSWSIGQGLLDDLLAGATPQQAQASALASPYCPPGQLGAQQVGALAHKAAALAATVASVDGDITDLPIDLPLGPPGRLQGVVRLHGNQLVLARFGRLKAAQLAICWVRLLAAAAQCDKPLVGKVFSSNGQRQLVAPPAKRAGALLADIVATTRLAATTLVPLPVETAAARADVFGRGASDSALEPDQLADEAFAGRYGEGHQPAWRMLLRQPSLSALRAVGPPGFDELSLAFWRPVIEAMKAPRPRLIGGAP